VASSNQLPIHSGPLAARHHPGEGRGHQELHGTGNRATAGAPTIATGIFAPFATGLLRSAAPTGLAAPRRQRLGDDSDPARTGKLNSLWSRFDAALLDSAESGTSRQVEVRLPAFATNTPVELPPALDRMASGKIVDDTDLSGIAGKPGGLVVTNVVHQFKIAVDENGTEAAAATAVVGPAQLLRHPESPDSPPTGRSCSVSIHHHVHPAVPRPRVRPDRLRVRTAEWHMRGPRHIAGGLQLTVVRAHPPGRPGRSAVVVHRELVRVGPQPDGVDLLTLELDPHVDQVGRKHPTLEKVVVVGFQSVDDITE